MDFEEDVADIGDGGFKDETIGHWKGFRQPIIRILFLQGFLFHPSYNKKTSELIIPSYQIF
jgi:hypothetical protein